MTKARTLELAKQIAVIPKPLIVLAEWQHAQKRRFVRVVKKHMGNLLRTI